MPGNAAYTEFGGFRSATALRLWDKFTDDNARIVRPTDKGRRLRATMKFGGSDYRARFTFGVRGTDAGGSTVQPWHFRFSQGTPAALEAFDGSAWVAVGKLSGALPSKQYRTLSIEATSDRATVTLGDESFTTTVSAASASALHSLTFTTGDPAEYGGIYFLDDFSVSVKP